jgi:hypothetical protein
MLDGCVAGLKPSSSLAATALKSRKGIVTEVLLTAEIINEFKVPIWAILAAHAAIATGTFQGGWRIVHTMGRRLTKLKSRGRDSARKRERPAPFCWPRNWGCRYRPRTLSRGRSSVWAACSGSRR